MNGYNLSSLFDIAFGIKSVGVYKVNETSERNGLDINYAGVEVTEDLNVASRMSYLGTPIVFPMTFVGKSYQVYTDIGEMGLRNYADFELPAATLVNFRRAKIISKTKAVASSGTVKELYGFDDWIIDIRGLCLADPSHPTAKTARDQERLLLDFENVVDNISVLGALFTSKKINSLVIEELNISQLKGKPGVIPFYIKCRSDQPIELFI